MAWKEVSTTAIDIKKGGIGVPYIGTYLGSEEIKTPLGQQMIWRFADQDEQPFSVYGFTNLNRSMSHVATGKLCRITYRGTKNLKTKFGMKDVHMVTVEVDDEAGSEEEAPEAEVVGA